MAAETVVESAPVITEKAVTDDKKEIAAEEAAAASNVTEQEKKDLEQKANTENESSDKCKRSTFGRRMKKDCVPPPPAVHKKDFEKDVVYLYQFNRTPVIPSVSPFCFKVETWLKLQGIKYENVEHGMKLRSKKGFLPFIELNGEEINESDVIIDTLGEIHGKKLDDPEMSEDQKGVQHAMITMVDNHLNWCYTHWSVRDVNNTIKGYQVNLQEALSSKIPNSVLVFMMKYTYMRKTSRRLKAAGFGVFTDEEVDNMGKKDLKVLSDLLGEKSYFFGSEMRTLDLKFFVWLAMILNVNEEVPFPLREYMKEECKNLVDLYERIKERAWGEHWAEATGEKLELNPHIPKPEPVVVEEKKDESETKKDEKEGGEEEKKKKENEEQANTKEDGEEKKKDQSDDKSKEEEGGEGEDVKKD